MLARILRFIAVGVVLLIAGIAAIVFFPFEQQLVVTDHALDQLRAFRAEAKFTDLPGEPAERERQRMEPLFNDLIDRLIVGLPQHPKRSWVLAQMDPVVDAFHLEDTELRERCVSYVERLLGILSIHRVNGAFWKYLVFI